jgi:exodeoxyribonuclease III
MKVATFNVNNINKRLSNLLAWLKAAEPDVVCLQELKATDAEFPQDAIQRAGYDAIWRGQKTGDFGNAIEVIRIGDCFPFRVFAKNS